MTSLSRSPSKMGDPQHGRPADATSVGEPRQIAPNPIVTQLGKGLHELYDGVPKSTLPIYFGPVLGELYLTPLPRWRSA